MDFNTLLLLAIIWLLWTIHQDLVEGNDRQRGIKALLQQLYDARDTAPESGATKRGTRRSTRTAD